MSKRRRRRAKDVGFHKAAVVNELLDMPKVDIALLRSKACESGLSNRELRCRAWPVLLGPAHTSCNHEEYQHLTESSHRDRHVVDVDVQRSLWSYTDGWSDEKRDAARTQLKGLLNAAVSHHAGQAFYYQGLHDIASVLLFEIGERPAFIILRHLLTNHLRDFTRPTLEPVMELLELLMPLLEHADNELHAHILKSGAPPYFALSWLITWFAHNIAALDQITRLFDLFLASHPLMPLYVAVVAMKASRIVLLKCDLDAAEMHRALHNLSITAFASVDRLSQEASDLFTECPPLTVIHTKQLYMSKSCAAEARLVDGFWRVPDAPQPRKFGKQKSLRLISYQGLSFAAAAVLLAAVFTARSFSEKSFGGGPGFLHHMPPLL